MKSMQLPPPGTLARAPATRRPALRHSLLTLAVVFQAACLSSLDGGAPDGAAASHDTPGDVPPSPSCLPGRSLPCICPDGRAGARVCLASGQAYTPCTCESPAPPPASPPAPCPLPPPADCSRAAGVCAGAVPRCVPALGWVCRPEPPVPFQPLGETLCDGLDNDCDGEVDEVPAGVAPIADRAVGACTGARKVCAGDRGWVEPDYRSLDRYEPVETACDGFDNDCDGLVDEPDDLAVPGALLHGGVCAGTQPECAGEAGWIEPDYRSLDRYEPVETACDGLDNDCNGKADDISAVFAPLADRTVGLCAGARKVCAGGRGWVEPDYARISGYEATETDCDGVDSDCNGVVDDVPAALAPPAHLQEGVCAGARQVCGPEGAWTEPDYRSLDGYKAAETACDGLDNDCDGLVDEPDDLVAPDALLQAGVCAGARQVCVREAGWMEPDYAQIDGYVETETGCDGLDNDCDGEVDEEREVDGWICVTPGRFFMGSPEDDDLGASRQNEPYHEVELTRGFWIKATEVTRAEWREAMAEQDETPRESIFEACGDDCPIDTLTRHEGIAYCNAVSVPEDRCYQDPDDGSDYSLEDARLGIEPAWPDGLDCLGVRLPTEAEWEYAARAGTEGWLYCDDPVDGPDWLDKLDTLAWYCANSGAHYPTPGACGCDAEPDTGFCGIQPVGRKLPNPWGLFDVLGNVEEWVWDLVTWYYGVWDPEPVVDPIGVGQQIPWRVAVRRGGHYNHRPEYCRMAARTLGSAPRFGVGMRPVRTIPVRGQ